MSKKMRGGFAVFVGLLVCGLVYMPVAMGAEGKLEKQVIKIGYAGGINFVFGKQMLQSLQDAVEEVNSAGGVLGSKFEVVSADTGLTAAGASSAISKLMMSDKVDVIMGAYTSEESTAFQTESAKNKILTIIHATTDQTDENYMSNKEKYKYCFAASTSETSIGDIFSKEINPMMAKRLQDQLGLKKINVALVTDKALWTVKIDKMVLKGIETSPDMQLVYYTKPARDASDFTTELTEIRKKDVQLVVMFGGYGSTIPFVKQFSQLKIPAILTGDIILAQVYGDFIKAVGEENAAYVTTGSFGTQGVSPRMATLISKFKAKYNWEPGHYAVEGYNFVKCYAKALTSAKTMDNNVLIPAMEKVVMPPEEAWGGTFKFVNHRLVKGYPDGIWDYVLQYKAKGGYTIIWPDGLANSKLVIPPHMVSKWKK